MTESISSKLSRYTGDEDVTVTLHENEEPEATHTQHPTVSEGRQQQQQQQQQQQPMHGHITRCAHAVIIVFYLVLLLGWVVWFPLAVLLPLWCMALQANGSRCPLIELQAHVLGEAICSELVEAEHYILIYMCLLSAIVYSMAACP